MKVQRKCEHEEEYAIADFPQDWSVSYIERLLAITVCHACMSENMSRKLPPNIVHPKEEPDWPELKHLFPNVLQVALRTRLYKLKRLQSWHFNILAGKVRRKDGSVVEPELAKEFIDAYEILKHKDADFWYDHRGAKMGQLIDLAFPEPANTRLNVILARRNRCPKPQR